MKTIANVLENKSNAVMFFATLGLFLLMLAAPMSAATPKCQARLTDDTAQAQLTCDADAPVADQTTKTDAS